MRFPVTFRFSEVSKQSWDDYSDLLPAPSGFNAFIARNVALYILITLALDYIANPPGRVIRPIFCHTGLCFDPFLVFIVFPRKLLTVLILSFSCKLCPALKYNNSKHPNG